MRILCLDYGEKRIGVAVSDELEITARGVATISRKGLKRDLEMIADMIGTCEAEKIVVGYPLRLDGTAGIQCEKVDRFIQALGRRFPLPVERWDETLSTREAEEILSENLVGRKKRKQVVDRLAASIILLSYLEAQRKKQSRLGGA
jgi:putative Holliday junction resolvase